jgi:hypothetical protein
MLEFIGLFEDTPERKRVNEVSAQLMTGTRFLPYARQPKGGVDAARSITSFKLLN